MRLIYHVLFSDTLLPTVSQWLEESVKLGFALEFDAAWLPAPLSRTKRPIGIGSLGIATQAQISTSPVSDLADICDELNEHINEEQNLDVVIEFNDRAERLPSVSMAVATLAKITNATVYIEGDGVFCTADEALATARSWGKQGK